MSIDCFPERTYHLCNICLNTSNNHSESRMDIINFLAGEQIRGQREGSSRERCSDVYSAFSVAE